MGNRILGTYVTQFRQVSRFVCCIHGRTQFFDHQSKPRLPYLVIHLVFNEIHFYSMGKHIPPLQPPPYRQPQYMMGTRLQPYWILLTLEYKS